MCVRYLDGRRVNPWRVGVDGLANCLFSSLKLTTPLIYTKIYDNMLIDKLYRLYRFLAVCLAVVKFGWQKFLHVLIEKLKWRPCWYRTEIPTTTTTQYRTVLQSLLVIRARIYTYKKVAKYYFENIRLCTKYGQVCTKIWS